VLSTMRTSRSMTTARVVRTSVRLRFEVRNLAMTPQHVTSENGHIDDNVVATQDFSGSRRDRGVE